MWGVIRAGVASAGVALAGLVLADLVPADVAPSGAVCADLPEVVAGFDAAAEVAATAAVRKWPALEPGPASERDALPSGPVADAGT
ncbi:exported hypothetical protein [Frankia sp. AiPs1]